MWVRPCRSLSLYNLEILPFKGCLGLSLCEVRAIQRLEGRGRIIFVDGV